MLVEESHNLEVVLLPCTINVKLVSCTELIAFPCNLVAPCAIEVTYHMLVIESAFSTRLILCLYIILRQVECEQSTFLVVSIVRFASNNNHRLAFAFVICDRHVELGISHCFIEILACIFAYFGCIARYHHIIFLSRRIRRFEIGLAVEHHGWCECTSSIVKKIEQLIVTCFCEPVGIVACMVAYSKHASRISLLKICVQESCHSRTVATLLCSKLLNAQVALIHVGSNAELTLSQGGCTTILMTIHLGHFNLHILQTFCAATWYAHLECTDFVISNRWRYCDMLLAACYTVNTNNIVETAHCLYGVVCAIDSTLYGSEIAWHHIIFSKIALNKHLNTYVITIHTEVVPTCIIAQFAIDPKRLVSQAVFYSRERIRLSIGIIRKLSISVTCIQFFACLDWIRLAELHLVPTNHTFLYTCTSAYITRLG